MPAGSLISFVFVKGKEKLATVKFCDFYLPFVLRQSRTDSLGTLEFLCSALWKLEGERGQNGRSTFLEHSARSMEIKSEKYDSFIQHTKCRGVHA